MHYAWRVWFFWVGLGVLFVNKIRYSIMGYHRPRVFSVLEQEKAHAYAQEVLALWKRGLDALAHDRGFLGARVLELGSGADLAPGILLLAEGARSYTALDKHALLEKVPSDWYAPVLAHVRDAPLRERIAQDVARASVGELLSYVHDAEFRLAPLDREGVDIVVSHNAFEHFSHVSQTLEDITRVVAPRGLVVLHVDLQTHTRALRERDPLNIYRYPAWLYRLLRFPGIPNRVRPEVYVRALERLGWTRVQCIPTYTLRDAQAVQKFHTSGLSASCRIDARNKDWLSFLVVAQK